MKKGVQKLLVMGISYTVIGFFFQLLLVNLLWASETKAQKISKIGDVFVHVELQDNTLGETFRMLESMTSFKFVYDKKDPFLMDRVSLEKRAISVEDLLVKIATDARLSFKQINNNITVNEHVEGRADTNETGDLALPITGRVTDQNGEPLPGVTVSVPGTAIGTATDLDGRYTLDVPEGSTLVFSFIGFETQSIAVGGRSVIDVVLAEDMTSLDEVVVVGYSTLRKKDITGSVSVVDVEKLKDIPATSLTQKLQGQASGVMIGTHGAPNSPAMVRIRGIGSTNSNGPLYVIDGVSTRSQDLNSINPNDIESVQILKDASAASIYGARASNGVIIITTKRGQLGVPKITYDGYAGLATPFEYFDLLGSYDRIDLEWEAKLNAFAIRDLSNVPSHAQFGTGTSPTIPKYVIPAGSNGPFTLEDYNFENNRITEFNVGDGHYWYDAMVQTAVQQSHQLSVSGASESASYLFGLNYVNKEGTEKHSYYKRYSARLNMEFKPFKRLRVGENLTLSFSSDVMPDHQGENTTFGRGVQMNPWLPIYDIAGNFAGTGAPESGKTSNPVAMLYRAKDNYNTDMRIFGNVYAEVDILDGLKFRTLGGLDHTRAHAYNMDKRNIETAEPTTYNQLNESASYRYNYQWTNTLNFEKFINDIHQLNVLVGSEAIWSGIGRSMSGYRRNYLFEDNTDTWTLALGETADMFVTSSWGNPVYMFGLFSRVDYSFNDRYLVSGTIRRDGSSRFSEANRYGFFPSASVGWRLSEENFLDNVEFLDDLKIRAGYGTTGNSEIPNAYNWATEYHTYARNTNYDFDATNTSAQTGYALKAFGNPDTKWETSRSWNIGMDWSIFQGLFGGSIEFFDRYTSDMLVADSYTALAGQGSPPFVNLGNIENRGFDIDLRHDNTVGSVTYYANVNLSHYKNEVKKLSESVGAQFWGGSTRFGNVTLTQAGLPMSSFYGFKILGFYESEEDVFAYQGTTGDRSGQTVLPYGVSSDESLVAKHWVGKYKYEDSNGDGRITAADKVVIGNPHPDFTGGANFGVGFRNFDLSASFYFSVGNDIYNYTKYLSDFWSYGGNRSTTMRDRSWEPGKEDAVLPVLDFLDNISNNDSHDYYVEDGSFLRLQRLSLGYTVPVSSINSLRIYIQGGNLFTITNYSGIDPDLTNQTPGDGGDLTRGMDFWNWPKSKEVILGLNMAF